MMRKLYGFFNKTFSLLITTCCDNAWHVHISMPPPLNQILVETVCLFYLLFWGRGVLFSHLLLALNLG